MSQYVHNQITSPVKSASEIVSQHKSTMNAHVCWLNPHFLKVQSPSELWIPIFVGQFPLFLAS